MMLSLTGPPETKDTFAAQHIYRQFGSFRFIVVRLHDAIHLHTDFDEYLAIR